MGGVLLLLELAEGRGKAPLNKEASRSLRREACAPPPGDLALLEPVGPQVGGAATIPAPSVSSDVRPVPCSLSCLTLVRDEIA